MSTTNIDRSLDDIIKEQRKIKKKTQKLKTQQAQKKGAQQRQGKKQGRGASSNQNRGRRIAGKQNAQPAQQRRGTQGKKALAVKQNQLVQKGRGTQNYRKQQTAGNAGRRKLGGAKITANRLKNKQGSLQKSKKIISKAKQVQQNRRPINRQNRQTQQKDARQNIINKRRGMQGPVKENRPNKAQNARNLNKKTVTSRLQRTNRRGNPAPQLTVSINNPQVRLNRTPQWKQVSNQGNNQTNRRRWRGGKGGAVDTGDLRISIPNNLHQPTSLKPLKPLYYSGYEPMVDTSISGKKFTTLNERFSSIPQRGVRTIVMD